MKIRGIVKGKSIQLLDSIALAEGSEVVLEVTEAEEKIVPNWSKLQEVIGTWKDDPEITKIFAQIDRKRHLDRGRDIDFDAL